MCSQIIWFVYRTPKTQIIYFTIIGDGRIVQVNFKSWCYKLRKFGFLAGCKTNLLPKYSLNDLILSVQAQKVHQTQYWKEWVRTTILLMDINSGIRDFIIQNLNGIIVKQGYTGNGNGNLESNQNKKDWFRWRPKHIKQSNLNSQSQLKFQNYTVWSVWSQTQFAWKNQWSDSLHGITCSKNSYRVLDENLTNCAVYGGSMYGQKLIDALLLEKIRPSVIFDSYTLNTKTVKTYLSSTRKEFLNLMWLHSS